MKRYSDPIAPKTGYGSGGANSIVNLAQAGTHVMTPDLANLASNTPQVNRNVIPFVIESPKLFKYAVNSKQLNRSFKALLENHVRTIEGLQQTITVEYAEAPYGGSGERIQVATNVTRAVSNINTGCWELQGRAIQRFLKWWITYGVGDENTKVPRIVAEHRVPPEAFTQDFAGATVLFVEPDASFQGIHSAYLACNFSPQSTGPWESRKDASQIGQNLDLNIEWTSIVDVSDGVYDYARRLFKTLNIKGLNPNSNRSWLDGIASDVLAADMGIIDQLKKSSASRVVYEGRD